MSLHRTTAQRAILTGIALAALSACNEPFDLDLRDNVNGFDTSRATQELPGRPRPDERGIISYPTYQVVVARQDDTIRGIAIRLGLDANELAEYNGVEPDTILRRDEIIALPVVIDDPALPAATNAAGQPLDVSAIATGALERANGVTTTSLAPVAQTPIAAPAATATAAAAASEPIRHQIVRGQTVYAVSRLYNVPVREIAELNGLDANFTVREGQQVLIPQGGTATRTTVAAAAPEPVAVALPTAVSAPGAGTTTPVPPSAGTPLPEDAPVPAAARPEAPDLGTPTPQPASSGSRFSRPLDGSIIRAYAPGRNEGIDIAAAAGSGVKAADGGTVAAVTNNTSGVAIVVIKHNDGLLTVYTNIDDLSVSKGDTVSRGQTIGKVRAGDPSFLHFEVREGLKSVDPTGYLP